MALNAQVLNPLRNANSKHLGIVCVACDEARKDCAGSACCKVRIWYTTRTCLPVLISLVAAWRLVLEVKSMSFLLKSYEITSY